MPAVKTQVSCPNCRMPVPISLEQLFDVAQDPSAKNRFINGRFNLINCPNCRYQGQMASLVLYHDPEKELLLSFVPMELGLPQAEQEKIIGKLMNEVINKLPQEKRKGYLLNPKPAFTLQGLVERVLEADGITKEMLDAQRAKSQLAQKLFTTPDDQLPEVVKEHDAEMDAVFFQMISASIEATAASGNQQAAQRMLLLQRRLLELCSFGAQAQKQQKLLESTLQELQKMGDKLNRDTLLTMVVEATEDEKLVALASLARPGMDYPFFEALTKRIDKAASPDKERLTHTRDVLLQIIKEIDEASQAQVGEATDFLRQLMEAPDPLKLLTENLPRVNDTFMAVLNTNLEAAQRANRPDVANRLNQIAEAIMQMMQESAPPEIQFVNNLLEMESTDAAERALKEQRAEITPQLLDTMNYVVDSLRQNNQAALADRLEHLRGVAMGELMAANWSK